MRAENVAGELQHLPTLTAQRAAQTTKLELEDEHLNRQWQLASEECAQEPIGQRTKSVMVKQEEQLEQHFSTTRHETLNVLWILRTRATCKQQNRYSPQSGKDQRSGKPIFGLLEEPLKFGHTADIDPIGKHSVRFLSAYSFMRFLARARCC